MKQLITLTVLLVSYSFSTLYSQFPEFTYEEIGETDENMLCQELSISLVASPLKVAGFYWANPMTTP